MRNFLMSTAALVTLAGTALADTHAADGMFYNSTAATEVRASDFIGMRVYTSEAGVDAEGYAGIQDNWNDVGEINDVILSRDGSVEAVLVDIGGFLGIGERQVAFDMSAIRFVSDSDTDADDFFLVVPASQAQLEEAPEYSITSAEMTPMNRDATGMGEEGAGGLTVLPDMTDTDTGMASAQNGTSDISEPKPLSDRDLAATDGIAIPEGYETAARETLTTESLEGARVYDSKDDWVGEVGQLLITQDGQITDAVIDVGGFLGIGEKPVALPIDKLQIIRESGGDDVRVYLPMSNEELDAMPTFEG